MSLTIGKLLSVAGFVANGEISAPKNEAEKPKNIIRLEEIKVEGRIQKPQAFYILQRASLNLGVLDLKESFLPKIRQSVEKEPF